MRLAARLNLAILLLFSSINHALAVDANNLLQEAIEATKKREARLQTVFVEWNVVERISNGELEHLRKAKAKAQQPAGVVPRLAMAPMPGVAPRPGALDHIALPRTHSAALDGVNSRIDRIGYLRIPALDPADTPLNIVIERLRGDDLERLRQQPLREADADLRRTVVQDPSTRRFPEISELPIFAFARPSHVDSISYLLSGHLSASEDAEAQAAGYVAFHYGSITLWLDPAHEFVPVRVIAAGGYELGIDYDDFRGFGRAPAYWKCVYRGPTGELSWSWSASVVRWRKDAVPIRAQLDAKLPASVRIIENGSHYGFVPIEFRD